MSKTFEEAIEALKQATTGEEFKLAAIEVGDYTHSTEQLDEFRNVIYPVRERVFEFDPDFKREIEAKQNAREVQFKADRAILDGEMAAEVERHKAKYGKEISRMTRGRGDLVCPICRDLTGFNFINDKMVCSACGHELIEKDKLRDYNRAYRRNWKRNRS